MYCTMRVLRTRSMDYRTVLYLGYWLLILLPWKTTVMAQAKEILGCCGGDFNAQMRCDGGTVIQIQDVFLARNNWCISSLCCTGDTDCQVSAEDKLPGFYADVMSCEGKTECPKTPPDDCPSSVPGCTGRPTHMEFIRIEYACVYVTIPPKPPRQETPMIADNTNKVSTVWPVTSFNDVTTASDVTPSVAMVADEGKTNIVTIPPTTPRQETPMIEDNTSKASTTTAIDVTPTISMVADEGKTNIGVWVGVAIAIGLSIVAVVVLIIYCTRRSRTQGGPAAASLANTNIEGETVRNDNLYVMDNREPSPHDSAIAATDQSDYQYANYNGNPFSNSAPSSDQHNPQTADSYASYDTACAVDDAPSVGDVSHYATPRRYGNTEVAKSGPSRDESGAQREMTTSGREGGAEMKYSADQTDPESEDEARYELKLQENELYQSNSSKTYT